MAELAWPEDIGHGTFTGRFGFMDADSHDPDRAPDITSATGGTVTITPSIKSVRYSGAQGPMILVARPAKGVIDSEGYLCTATADGDAGDRGMVFPATDDTDLTPTDWTYTVSVLLDGDVRIPSFSVKLPAGSAVDLSLAAPVPSSGGTAVVVDPTTAERAENAATRAEAAATAAEEWTPTFEWNGTSLVINDDDPVDLKGEKGDTPTWSDLPGKPTSFPPAAHTHTLTDVDGLTARLAALEYDSGWRDVSGLINPVYRQANPNATAHIIRVGKSVTFNFYQGLDATYSGLLGELLMLPDGFRTGPGATRPWGSPGLDHQSGKQITDGAGIYIDTSGTRISTFAVAGKRYAFTMRFLTPDPIPTALPGTPA